MRPVPSYGAGQPVAQLLALRLLAAAAHQGGGEQRLGLPAHLQPHPGHAAEQARLDAEQRVVEQRLGVPDQLLPVLDQIGAAGVQEAHLRIGVDRRAVGQRPVQLGDMAAVQPVRGVREQQVPAGLQHRLHPPAQPVPGVQGAAVRGALLAEAVPVPVHLQQRGGGVGPQRVQAEPGVGHARVEPDRGPELLLGLDVGAHGVRVHAAQPGEVGRGARAVGAEVHQSPPIVPPRPSPPPAPTAMRRAEVEPGGGTPCRRPHPPASYPRTGRHRRARFPAELRGGVPLAVASPPRPPSRSSARPLGGASCGRPVACGCVVAGRAVPRAPEKRSPSARRAPRKGRGELRAQPGCTVSSDVAASGNDPRGRGARERGGAGGRAGQDEAPGHGGTTGGSVLRAAFRGRLVENVIAPRASGQVRHRV